MSTTSSLQPKTKKLIKKNIIPIISTSGDPETKRATSKKRETRLGIHILQ